MAYAPYYTTVDICYQVVTDLGSVTDLSSAQICDAFIKPAESIINAKLAKLYVVPISPAPNLLEAIATDIALYRILTQRIFNQQRLKDNIWPERFKEAMTLLDQIANGEVTLITTTGSVSVITPQASTVQATSTTENYNQTFHEGEPVDQIQDQDKIDNLLNDRGIGGIPAETI